MHIARVSVRIVAVLVGASMRACGAGGGCHNLDRRGTVFGATNGSIAAVSVEAES
jgi:hypothetical protein